MEKDNENILTKAFENAKRHEMESGGCSQCALAGIFEALDIENADVFRAAAGLADGVRLNRRRTLRGPFRWCHGHKLSLWQEKEEDFGDMMKLLDAYSRRNCMTSFLKNMAPADVLTFRPS